MNDPLYTVLRSAHIAAGSLALAMAAWALLSRKGQPRHRLAGRVYVLAMLAVSLTAWSMALLKPNAFLFIVAVFSAFLVLSGYARARNRTGTPSRLEWLLALAGAGTGMALLLTPYLFSALSSAAALVFGAISLILGTLDLWSLSRRRYSGAPRIASHVGHMMGGTIATLTAVSVVNLQGFMPHWLTWLLPTALLLPVIAYWNWQLLRTERSPSGSTDNEPLEPHA